MTNDNLDAYEDEFEDVDTSLNLTNEMFQRRLVWDVVPCEMAPAVLKALGLPAVSPDVETREHEVAHERLDALGPLDITANAFAFHIAKTQVAAIQSQYPDSTMNFDALYPLLSAAAKGFLAELLDLGLIHQPHGGGGPEVETVFVDRDLQ